MSSNQMSVLDLFRRPAGGQLFVRTVDVPYTYTNSPSFRRQISRVGRSAAGGNKGGAEVSHLAVNRAQWVVALAIVLALPWGALQADEPAAKLPPAED